MVDHTKWLKDKHDPDDPIQKLAVWTEMTYDGPKPTRLRWTRDKVESGDKDPPDQGAEGDTVSKN